MPRLNFSTIESDLSGLRCCAPRSELSHSVLLRMMLGVKTLDACMLVSRPMGAGLLRVGGTAPTGWTAIYRRDPRPVRRGPKRADTQVRPYELHILFVQRAEVVDPHGQELAHL